MADCDKAGSAAAPAARCRKRRRGSFKALPSTSLNAFHKDEGRVSSRFFRFVAGREQYRRHAPGGKSAYSARQLYGNVSTNSAAVRREMSPVGPLAPTSHSRNSIRKRSIADIRRSETTLRNNAHDPLPTSRAAELAMRARRTAHLERDRASRSSSLAVLLRRRRYDRQHHAKCFSARCH